MTRGPVRPVVAAFAVVTALALGVVPAVAVGAAPSATGTANVGRTTSVDTTNRFLGVACSPTGSCAGVGSYTAGTNSEALLDVEAKGTWADVAVPLPAGAASAHADDALNAVTCPATGHCVADGQVSVANGTAALLEAESGSTWSDVVVPLPAGASTTAPDNSLSALACPAVGDCAAVGTYADAAGNQQALLVTEASGTWSAVVAPLPGDAGATALENMLNAVTCTATGDCDAVGSYTNAAGDQQALLVTEASGTWSNVVAPLPANASTSAPGNSLDAVSCADASDCTVAGSYVDATGDQQALLASSTGGTWASAAAPLPTGASATPNLNSLNSVACPAVGGCVAVGVYQNKNGYQHSLVDEESAGTWSSAVVPLPSDANVAEPFDTLGDLTCPVVGNCVAVGFYAGAKGYLYPQALMEIEDGGTWEPWPVQLPGDASIRFKYSVLSSVACVSIVACAVGGFYSDTAGGTQGLLDTYGVTLTNVSVVPSAPTDVTAIGGHGQAKVSWTVPLADGGSPVLSYTATAAPGGASCTTTTSTQCTIRPLTKSPSYSFSVTATSLLGTSMASAPTAPIGIHGVVHTSITVGPFAAGTSALTAQLTAEVSRLASVLVLWGDTDVALTGFDADHGSASASLVVSRARARAVEAALRQQLVDRGVNDVTITAVGRGNLDPVATNTTAPGRARNRRVVAALS